MAPADAPAVRDRACSPTSPAGNGGEVAGPAFSEMMAYALLHYRVPPSGTKPPTFKIWAS